MATIKVIMEELWHYRYGDDHLLSEAIMANNYILNPLTEILLSKMGIV